MHRLKLWKKKKDAKEAPIAEQKHEFKTEEILPSVMMVVDTRNETLQQLLDKTAPRTIPRKLGNKHLVLEIGSPGKYCVFDIPQNREDKECTANFSKFVDSLKIKEAVMYEDELIKLPGSLGIGKHYVVALDTDLKGDAGLKILDIKNFKTFSMKTITLPDVEHNYGREVNIQFFPDQTHVALVTTNKKNEVILLIANVETGAYFDINIRDTFQDSVNIDQFTIMEDNQILTSGRPDYERQGRQYKVLAIDLVNQKIIGVTHCQDLDRRPQQRDIYSYMHSSKSENPVYKLVYLTNHIFLAAKNIEGQKHPVLECREIHQGCIKTLNTFRGDDIFRLETGEAVVCDTRNIGVGWYGEEHYVRRLVVIDPHGKRYFETGTIEHYGTREAFLYLPHVLAVNQSYHMEMHVIPDFQKVLENMAKLREGLDAPLDKYIGSPDVIGIIKEYLNYPSEEAHLMQLDNWPRSGISVSTVSCFVESKKEAKKAKDSKDIIVMERDTIYGHEASDISELLSIPVLHIEDISTMGELKKAFEDQIQKITIYEQMIIRKLDAVDKQKQPLYSKDDRAGFTSQVKALAILKGVMMECQVELDAGRHPRTVVNKVLHPDSGSPPKKSKMFNRKKTARQEAKLDKQELESADLKYYIKMFGLDALVDKVDQLVLQAKEAKKMG